MFKGQGEYCRAKKSNAVRHGNAAVKQPPEGAEPLRGFNPLKN